MGGESVTTLPPWPLTVGLNPAHDSDMNLSDLSVEREVNPSFDFLCSLFNHKNNKQARIAYINENIRTHSTLHTFVCKLCKLYVEYCIITPNHLCKVNKVSIYYLMYSQAGPLLPFHILNYFIIVPLLCYYC